MLEADPAGGVVGARYGLGVEPGAVRMVTGIRRNGTTSVQLDDVGREVDVVIVNEGGPSEAARARYEAEHKHPLQLGTPPQGTEVVVGEFWKSDIARHERQRLSYTVWSVLSRRLLT